MIIKANPLYPNIFYVYIYTPENRKQKSDIFKDINIEMEHCLKLVNNHKILAR